MSVADSKIYKVTDIDFNNLTIEAKETDLSIDDVPDNGLWDMSYFGEFKIRLMNGKGKIKIIDMVEWIKRNKMD